MRRRPKRQDRGGEGAKARTELGKREGDVESEEVSETESERDRSEDEREREQDIERR